MILTLFEENLCSSFWVSGVGLVGDGVACDCCILDSVPSELLVRAF